MSDVLTGQRMYACSEDEALTPPVLLPLWWWDCIADECVHWAVGETNLSERAMRKEAADHRRWHREQDAPWKRCPTCNQRIRSVSGVAGNPDE